MLDLTERRLKEYGILLFVAGARRTAFAPQQQPRKIEKLPSDPPAASRIETKPSERSWVLSPDALPDHFLAESYGYGGPIQVLFDTPST